MNSSHPGRHGRLQSNHDSRKFRGSVIAHIIYGSRGALQWDRILELAADHWELVLWSLLLYRYVYPAHSGYVPQSLWKDLIGRLADEVGSPKPDAKFRGTLVDDAMFAIDVEEWGLDNLLAQQRTRVSRISVPPDVCGEPAGPRGSQ